MISISKANLRVYEYLLYPRPPHLSIQGQSQSPVLTYALHNSPNQQSCIPLPSSSSPRSPPRALHHKPPSTPKPSTAPLHLRRTTSSLPGRLQPLLPMRSKPCRLRHGDLYRRCAEGRRFCVGQNSTCVDYSVCTEEACGI